MKNENVSNKAVKGMNKIDPQLCEGDIESARLLVKKYNKNEVIKSLIFVKFKNINQKTINILIERMLLKLNIVQ